MFNFIRGRNTFWWAVLIASIFLIFLVVFSSLISDPANTYSWIETTRVSISRYWFASIIDAIGIFIQNDAIYGITVGILFSLVSLSFIYIFKINDIRKTTIHALAYGYFENFLVKLITNCSHKYLHYRVIIILPTFQLVEHPDIYMGDIKRILSMKGFETNVETSDTSFGRQAFFVQRKNDPPLPLYIDAPTTLKTLRKILELEADMPVGKVVEHKWWQRRFLELRSEFQAVIEQLLPSGSWGNIVFIESEDKEKFTRRIEEEVLKLEAEMSASSED